MSASQNLTSRHREADTVHLAEGSRKRVGAPGSGHNSWITVTDGLVRKVSRHVFSGYLAETIARQLERYAQALSAQPIAVPALHRVGLLAEPGGGFRVEHVTEWCPAPNLTTFSAPSLPGAVQAVLARIAALATMDRVGTLAVPLDASAQNFHVADGQVWLVDLFPPLPRSPDGTLSLAFLQHAASPVRRRLAAYAKGTVPGAIVHTLFTALARGDRPLRQITATVRGYPDWCYDVLPGGLAGPVRDHIRAQLDGRLRRHLLRSLASNAVCVGRGLAGVPAYRSGEDG